MIDQLLKHTGSKHEPEPEIATELVHRYVVVIVVLSNGQLSHVWYVKTTGLVLQLC